jgi:hypothetical protein
VRDDGHSRVVNDVFEIVDEEAKVVRRIHRDVTAGVSSMRIATALNAERVPGPRGGEWNASTIRGDPKKLVGILNNPIYAGRLVWGRGEWRKNPDSDRRERRSEWIKIDVPDLRIVEEELIESVRAEIAGRRRLGAKPSNRSRHLLSSLIRGGECGGYTLGGKEYYRCSRNRERGTRGSKASIRVAQVEDAVLAALQTQLLTPDLVKLFTEDCRREVDRLTRNRSKADAHARKRLAELETEIGNLAQHFLARTVSATLSGMLRDREAEKERLER